MVRGQLVSKPWLVKGSSDTPDYCQIVVEGTCAVPHLSEYCRATETTRRTLYCVSSVFASAAFCTRCCTVAADRKFKCRATCE